MSPGFHSPEIADWNSNHQTLNDKQLDGRFGPRPYWSMPPGFNSSEFADWKGNHQALNNRQLRGRSGPEPHWSMRPGLNDRQDRYHFINSRETQQTSSMRSMQSPKDASNRFRNTSTNVSISDIDNAMSTRIHSLGKRSRPSNTLNSSPEELIRLKRLKKIEKRV